MPRLNAFENGLALDLQTLRALLVDGDARDRIWAAWALGLKVGGGFASEATARSQREPDPGVRRHLVVVMAGLGEGAAVEVIATSDPDPYVRATAYRYVLQLFGSDAVPKVVSAAIADPSDVVREEAIRILEWKWPASRRDDLVTLLERPALGVRQAAADRLAEGPISPGELTTVVQRTIDESDVDLQRRLVTIVVGAGGADAIAAKMQDLTVEKLIEVMDVLHIAGVRMTWEQLTAIGARAVPAVDRRILQALRAAEEADLVWLARCAARSPSWPAARTRAEADIRSDVLDAGHLARTALLAKITNADPRPLDPEARTLFVAILEALRAEEADLRAEQQDLMDDENWDPTWLDQIAGHRRRLEMLIGQTERGA